MALKYVVNETVFGFDKTGTTKYVARPVLAGTVKYSELCDQIAKLNAVSPRSVVRMVLDGLAEVLEHNLTNNYSVKMGDLGTFRPGLNCKSQRKETDVKAGSFHRKVIFTASPHLRRVLGDTTVRKTEKR